MRRTLIASLLVTTVLLAACGDDEDDAVSTDAPAATDAAIATEAPIGDTSACADGKTLTPSTLTIATGNPAFEPWVVGDAPETGEGFEAAVAYAVADKMGFDATQVTWVRTDFDAAIQPGPKDFDFNMQQFSITDERAEIVSFSDPYYSSNQAVVTLSATATTMAELAELKLGAQAGTTSFQFITDVIKPSSDPYAYNDNVDAKQALESNQIDAIVLDLPTAFYVSAVELEGASILGQFPAAAGGTTDDFGMLFAQGNPLVECVNAALAELKDSGELAAIEQTWLADKTGAPVFG